MTPHDPTRTNPNARRAALDSFIAERMHMPFAWGSNDCCMFAADAVRAMNGMDHAPGLRGSYSTALEGMRMLEELGGLDALASRCGDPFPPLSSQPGDIGLVEHDGRSMLAVCQGSMWLLPAAGGLAALPFESASKSWRPNA